MNMTVFNTYRAYVMVGLCKIIFSQENVLEALTGPAARVFIGDVF